MIKKIIKENKLLLILIIIFIIINSLLLLYLPELMNQILVYGISKDLKSTYHAGLLMFITIIGITLLSIIISYISSLCSANIASSLRLSIYDKILSFSETHLHNFTISSLITRSTNDITNIQNTFNIGFKNLISALLISFLGIFKLAHITNSFLLLTIGLSIFLIITFILFLIIYTTPKFITLQNTTDELNRELREELNGLMTIKSFNNEKVIKNKYQQINHSSSRTDYQINKIMNLLNPFTTFILNAIIILITFTYLQNLTSRESVATMLSLSQYALQIISSFLTLALLFILIPKAKVSYLRLQEVLNVSSSLELHSIDPPCKITWQNVTYTYPQNSKPTLSNINFTINTGDKIAIIGPIGSGKSTLLKLLTKSLIPTQGEIYLDDKPYQNLSFQDLTTIYSYTPQKPYIFSGTLVSNLQIANPQANNYQLKKVLKNVTLTELKPTHKITPGATNLSGGQKQRLAIASGLIANKDFIIIDDIFANLDNETINRISRQLLTTYQDKTIIATTTNPQGLTGFNKIIILNKGKITHMGTHQELLNSDAFYTEVAYEQD